MLKCALTACAIASALSTVLFSRYTHCAFLLEHKNVMALAAPPAPRIITLEFSSSIPSSSSSLASPRISVLYPLNPPSTLTRVLTAPIALASGSISTRESITADLCGTVTLSPSILRL